jgi:hypothetical protein
MDIEGAEARALAGMAARLKASRIDRLLVELHPVHLRDQGSSADAVIGLLQSCGYQLWAIDHSAAAYRRAATMRRLEGLLTPVSSVDELGPWPHLLCARRGLSHGIV